MNPKIRVGILFGGYSRECEVSFAGGRTVFDCIDRSLYEPIPVFIGSHNELILIKWQYIYKGSIKDFYPCNDVNTIGTQINFKNLKRIVDIAFVVLHGHNGEDGHIQSILEWYNIPYTGTGVLGSILGLNKAIQKKLLPEYNYGSYKILNRYQWNTIDRQQCVEEIQSIFQLPFIIKSANQGSSIGVHVVNDYNFVANYIDSSFGQLRIKKSQWIKMGETQKLQLLTQQNDIVNGIGYSISINDKSFTYPNDILSYLDEHFDSDEVLLVGGLGDNEVVIEEHIVGREFSCMVFQKTIYDEPIALLPTEILCDQIFDYNKKYLPGAVKKNTPMETSKQIINTIRKGCVDIFKRLHFEVYARMDGFVLNDGRVVFNDPNTVSGMEPSSLIFQQAAQIGMTHTDVISFIIKSSLTKSRNTINNV